MSYQYKLVNGELVELTADEIAALEEREQHPPQLPAAAPDLGRLANQRLDRGIEAGYDAISQIDDDIAVRLRQRRQITPEDVEQQLSALTAALRTMINAQRAHEIPTPPPPDEPIEPEPQAAAATPRPAAQPTPKPAAKPTAKPTPPPKRGARK